MNTIQLANVVVAPTGTGLLYQPYRQGPDQAQWVNGSGATRSGLTYNRSVPKPTPTFPGVDRVEMKTNQFFTVGAVEYQAIVGVYASIPTIMSQADRQALWNRAIFMTYDGVFASALINNIHPS
jgi:hypothetical protein